MGNLWKVTYAVENMDYSRRPAVISWVRKKTFIVPIDKLVVMTSIFSFMGYVLIELKEL